MEKNRVRAGAGWRWLARRLKGEGQEVTGGAQAALGVAFR